MKINEVFEGLLKDKDSVYQALVIDCRYEMSVSEFGYFLLKVFNEHGKEIDATRGTGGFTGNLQSQNEWELVRQPVDFMTAANSEKRIRPINNAVYGFMYLDEWTFDLEGVNGKWLVE